MYPKIYFVIDVSGSIRLQNLDRICTEIHAFIDALMTRIDIALLPNLQVGCFTFSNTLVQKIEPISISKFQIPVLLSQGESNWKHSFSLLNKDANISFDDLIFVFTDGFFTDSEPDIVKDIPYHNVYLCTIGPIQNASIGKINSSNVEHVSLETMQQSSFVKQIVKHFT